MKGGLPKQPSSGACNSLPHRHPQVFALNTVCSIVIVVAKLPLMHGVRIFGINKY